MKTFHCCIHIDSFLAKRRNLNGMFAQDGRELSDREARELLSNWPYPYFTGCDNVDSKGQCLGHEEQSPSQAFEELGEFGTVVDRQKTIFDLEAV